MISKLGRAVLMVEIGVTDAKTTFKRPSGAPKTSQRWPPNPPKAIFGSKRRANQGHESSKMNLEALFGGSRGPSDLPRAFQELRKRARESPKTIAKPFLDRKRSFLQNVNILIVKSTFLTVGGSVYEFKIDPKRLREEIKNDIDSPIILPRPSPAARGEQTRPKRISR